MPVLSNVAASVAGVDLEHQLMLVVDAFFAILLVIQGALDFAYGSKSDGTAE